MGMGMGMEVVIQENENEDDCMICYDTCDKENLFECGRWNHTICIECAKKLDNCPMCKGPPSEKLSDLLEKNMDIDKVFYKLVDQVI